MTLTGTGAVLAILASAVVVLSGLAVLTRAIWRIAQDIRDNQAATSANTRALAQLTSQLDGRLTSIEGRLSAVERRRLRARLALSGAPSRVLRPGRDSARRPV